MHINQQVEAESSSQRAAAADDGAISQSVSALDRNVLRVSSMFASTSETAVSKNSPATRALASASSEEISFRTMGDVFIGQDATARVLETSRHIRT